MTTKTKTPDGTLKKLTLEKALNLSAASGSSPCSHCLREIADAVDSGRKTVFRVVGDSSWHVHATKAGALHQASLYN